MDQVPKLPTSLSKNARIYAAGLQAGTALCTLWASESMLNLKKPKLSIQTYHNLHTTNPNITLSTVISSFGVGKDPSVNMDTIIVLYGKHSLLPASLSTHWLMQILDHDLETWLSPTVPFFHLHPAVRHLLFAMPMYHTLVSLSIPCISFWFKSHACLDFSSHLLHLKFSEK